MTYSVTDYQATPSGYYRLMFRSTDGHVVIVTQDGRGGCNTYTNRTDAFDKWVEDNALMAATFYRRIDLEWAAQVIADREFEWEDSVVRAIADMIEMGIMSVKG